MPNKNEIREVVNDGFEEIDILDFGPYRPYRYFQAFRISPWEVESSLCLTK
jgi:hypothetical protein